MSRTMRSMWLLVHTSSVSSPANFPEVHMAISNAAFSSGLLRQGTGMFLFFTTTSLNASQEKGAPKILAMSR